MLDEQGQLIYKIVLGLIGLGVLISIIALGVWMISKLASLTAERRSNVDTSILWLKGYRTYLVVAVLIGYEFYMAYVYQTPINWATILEALGLGTIRATLKGVMNKQDEATEAASEAASRAVATQVTVQRAQVVTPVREDIPPTPVPKPREE